MRRLNKKGFTLVEAVVSVALLGMCALLITAMVSDINNNIVSVESSRGLYSVMENVLETYQIDVTRSRDIATGQTTLETQFNGRSTLSEMDVQRATRMDNGERIYVIEIKTYYKDRPKHFIVDKVVMSRGIGVNAD